MLAQSLSQASSTSLSNHITTPHPPANGGYQTALSRDIERRSFERWGSTQPTVLIGRHHSLTGALEKLAHFAASESTVLITGETGTGKELFARALHLLSPRWRGPFFSVNCGRFAESQLIVSELFGHKRGSFTGAVADHHGVFEEAEGGVVFLDEVGELTLSAQAMLLRVLSEHEVRSLGVSRAKRVNVRVIAATNRDLKALVAAGTFRSDLYFRLRQLRVHVPAIRERGSDWELIADYQLQQLGTRATTMKCFSEEARTALAEYPWPGNVRELLGVVDAAFHLSDGPVIERLALAELLEEMTREEELRKIPLYREPETLLSRMTSGGQTFWDAVYRPFMSRDLSRAEVREVVAQGLYRTRGSYKKLVTLFGIEQADYLKFMDFLRHQQLKPE
ncbi:MAG TPA: sigma 54-interacting transcriptional regulator [Gemmatimonadaceae bacterium]|nr:sigma 54-interacting transcriptional regulator [Gemmatimonadaceae bacterium]